MTEIVVGKESLEIIGAETSIQIYNGVSRSITSLYFNIDTVSFDTLDSLFSRTANLEDMKIITYDEAGEMLSGEKLINYKILIYMSKENAFDQYGNALDEKPVFVVKLGQQTEQELQIEKIIAAFEEMQKTKGE